MSAGEKGQEGKGDVSFLSPFPPFWFSFRLSQKRQGLIVRVKCWKVAHWNAQRLLKNSQKSKKLLLKFKTCCQNFCILLYKRQFKAFFWVLHNNYFHRSRKVIFGMNTMSDISKLLYVISRDVRLHTTTRKRFVIFTCRYFKLSEKKNCFKPIKLQKFLM